MRNEIEMMDLLIHFAKNDNRIRLVTLEGSRTNKKISRDSFQDFDISYFVTDIDSFKVSDQWLTIFGNRLMMQKPEDMELFPPQLGNRFSYLMLFEDGNRIDLTLIPIDEVDVYFSDHDGLVEVLLDKDSLVKKKIIPSDRKYWIRKSTAKEFDDCCNEFWWVSTYVVKGLARKELLYAIDHLNEMVRPRLLLMMSWQIGLEHDFSFSLGKNYKFIQHYLPKEDWKALLTTYSQDSYTNVWQSLFTCLTLFRKYSQLVSKGLGYTYPGYDEAITKYTLSVFDSLNI